MAILTLIAALTMLFVALVGVGLLMIRLTQPMPALLYRANDEIRLRALSCASLFTTCEPADRALLDHLDSVDSMAQASPDGTLIAVRYSGDWRLFPTDCLLASMTCPGQPMGLPADTMRLAWGPQSDALLYLINGGDIIRVLTRGCLPGQSGSCQQTDVKTGLNGLHTPAWSADGRRIIISGSPKGLLLLDAGCLSVPTSCALSPFLPNDSTHYWWANLSGDGQCVLYQENGASSEVILIRDLASGQRRALTPEFNSLASTPVWDTSERYLAYVLSDMQTAALIVTDLARDKSVPLTRPGTFAFFPEWLSPP